MIEKFLHKTLQLPYALNIEALRKVENPRATVFFIHGLASGIGMWSDFVDEVRGDYDIFALDLLGHGESPRPEWEGSQALEVQARAIRKAIAKNRAKGKPIFLVGHSMGSLISAEIARRYPKMAKKIFLLSPPIYQKDKYNRDIKEAALKLSYREILANKKSARKFVNTVIDAGLVPVERFDTMEDFRPVVRSLEEAIVNQNTFATLLTLETPTRILYGIFDPVVVASNIRLLGRRNKAITTKRFLASHDPTTEMIKTVSKEINKALKEENA